MPYMKFHKRSALPATPEANACYLLEGANAGDLEIAVVSDDGLSVRKITTTAAQSLQTYTESLTSGSLSYDVAHGLNGIVLVQLINKTTGEYVETSNLRLDDNTVRVTLSTVLTDDLAIMCTLAGNMP